MGKRIPFNYFISKNSPTDGVSPCLFSYVRILAGYQACHVINQLYHILREAFDWFKDYHAQKKYFRPIKNF